MQRANGCLLLWVVFLSATNWLHATDPPKKNPVEADFERISGRWRLIACTIDGIKIPDEILNKVKVTIAERKLLVKPGLVASTEANSGETTFRLEDNFEAKLEIDLTTKPISVDLLVVDGKETVRLKGIYKLDADKLSLCFSLSGTRPTEFKAAVDSKFRMLLLQREKQ